MKDPDKRENNQKHGKTPDWPTTRDPSALIRRMAESLGGTSWVRDS